MPAIPAGDGASNLGPTSRLLNHFGTHLPALTRCFRAGGGISYSAYRPVITQLSLASGGAGLGTVWGQQVV